MAFLLLVDGMLGVWCGKWQNAQYETHALSRFPISRPDGSGKRRWALAYVEASHEASG